MLIRIVEKLGYVFEKGKGGAEFTPGPFLLWNVGKEVKK